MKNKELNLLIETTLSDVLIPEDDSRLVEYSSVLAASGYSELCAAIPTLSDNELINLSKQTSGEILNEAEGYVNQFRGKQYRGNNADKTADSTLLNSLGTFIKNMAKTAYDKGMSARERSIAKARHTAEIAAAISAANVIRFFEHGYASEPQLRVLRTDAKIISKFMNKYAIPNSESQKTLDKRTNPFPKGAGRRSKAQSVIVAEREYRVLVKRENPRQVTLDISKLYATGYYKPFNDITSSRGHGQKSATENLNDWLEIIRGQDDFDYNKTWKPAVAQNLHKYGPGYYYQSTDGAEEGYEGL